MAKRQALLFELMREKEGDPPKKKGLWDHLFRRPAAEKSDRVESNAPAAEAACPPATDSAAPEPAYSPPLAPPAPSAPVRETKPPAPVDEILATAPADEEEPGRTRIFLRINAFTVILGAAVVLVVFFCGFILGRQLGWQAGVRARSTVQFGAIAAQEPNEAVLDIKDKAPETAGPAKAAARTAAQPAKDILPNEGKSTRKAGANYLIIQYFEEMSDAERARAFLAEKEIGATIEREGRLYALVSTAPFKSNKEPAAVQFQAQIRAYGQQYRRQKEALGVDFQTCFYKKWK